MNTDVEQAAGHAKLIIVLLPLLMPHIGGTEVAFIVGGMVVKLYK